MVAEPHGGGLRGAMGPPGPIGWGDHGGTHLAEELVIVLRHEQKAAAQGLGFLLQLWGDREGVNTSMCSGPPRAGSGPSLPPWAPTRSTQDQVPP